MPLLNEDYYNNIDKQLSALESYINSSFEVEKEIESMTAEEAQKFLEERQNRISEILTEKLTKIRNDLVSSAKAQYQYALEKLKIIKNLVEKEISMDTVVEVVKDLITVITGPYQPLIEFTEELIPALTKISDHLLKIASYQPPVVRPDVKLPPFQIEIEPIRPEDIL